MAFFIALIITVFQYFYKTEGEGKLNYLLSLFRFLSVFFIVLIFINPTIKKTSYINVKPKLFVAVDNSQSIKFNKNDSVVNRLVKQIETNKNLNSKFDINFYSFGDNIQLLDSLNFDESASNLTLPLKTFSEISSNYKAPILLISDGNQTTGTVDYTNYKNTIYPIVIGDTTTYEDIKISSINTNKTANLNNNFPVEIFINYDGNQSISKKLSIYNGKKLVYTKKLKLSKLNSSQNILLYLKADKKGNQYFKATIEALKNEKNKENNSANFSIKVIEKITKIAIISTIKHPDIGTIKKAIESKKQFKVNLINNLDKNIKHNDYQLFIIYQPSNSLKSLFSEINKLHKNYFIIAGLDTDWNYLNTTQTYYTKNSLQNSEKYEGNLNKDYSKFTTNNFDFSDFPPLATNFGDFTFNVPYEVLLFKWLNGKDTKQPLLVTLRSNNQKIAILDGEDIWKWRMYNFSKEKSFLKFDNFIANLIQYLSTEKSKNRIEVRAKPIYNTNETVKIIATYFNENSEIDTRKRLWLTFFNEQHKRIKKIPFIIAENQYKVFVSGLESGLYKYKISDEKELVYYQNSFKITNFNLEKQYRNSDLKRLSILAKNNSGEITYPKELNRLINKLVATKNYQVIQNKVQETVSLINIKWLLFLIVFFLSTEWFVRKYLGKM
jgi:hypothetical protein